MGEAGDGLEAVRIARQLQPDVAVVDAQLPRLSGVEVVRSVRDVSPRTEIVVLTAHDDEFTVSAMLRAGARGYMVKDSPVTDLVRAIRGASVGKAVLDPSIAGLVVNLFKDGRQASTADSTLTLREREIFKLVADGNTSRDIASELGLSPKTIDNCRATILRKLNARNRAEAISIGLRQGILSVPMA